MAACILLTLRETLETEPIQEGLSTNINTLPPSLSITDFIDESTTDPG